MGYHLMRLVHGWGINDADYVVYPTGEDGKQHMCPIYRCWKGMIERCHLSKKYPTYVGCRVDERWRSLMTFRTWYLAQDRKRGEQLDKDYLGSGKLYSPETCCFVSQELNKLFIDSGAKRGPWPQGVHYHKQTGKFQTQISCKGKQIHLGYSNTPGEAIAVYLKAKAAYVEELILENPHWPLRLVAAVRRKMRELIEWETHSK